MNTLQQTMSGHIFSAGAEPVCSSSSMEDKATVDLGLKNAIISDGITDICTFGHVDIDCIFDGVNYGSFCSIKDALRSIRLDYDIITAQSIAKQFLETNESSFFDAE